MEDKEDEDCTCRPRNPFLIKPLSVVAAEEETDKLERTLSLVDLLAIGIGGTVGSGVFVLAGEIANSSVSPAGPSATLSFMAAGIGCIFSGLSFAEMASRIPSAGSSYAYAYVTLGEMLAFVAGCCLTLEYGVSSAAMARIWGEKLVTWLDHMGYRLWDPRGNTINIYAGVMETICVLIMLRGVNLSKITVNVFTVLKLALVAFMTIGGFVYFKRDHLTPFAPSGFDGVFRGALTTFFGYLGYDEVCCLGAEAKNPHKNIPLAVMGCITGVTVLYVAATLALVGMQPYRLISTSSGFPEAFRYNGLQWAAELVAVGELVTIPLVVLVSLIAQPRLQFAMAEDGLLPQIFARVDGNGNLFMGTLICGAVCVVIAVFLPFTMLDDMISAGLLFAFNLTNTGLIIFRRADPNHPSLCRGLVALFNLLAIASSFTWVYAPSELLWLKCLLYSLTAMAVLAIDRLCAEQQTAPHPGFTTPLVPWLPAIGACFNWFLLAQLTWDGIAAIALYIAASIVVYFLYGYRRSVGARTGWKDRLTEAKRRRSSSGLIDSELVRGLLVNPTADRAGLGGSSSSSITPLKSARSETKDGEDHDDEDSEDDDGMPHAPHRQRVQVSTGSCGESGLGTQHHGSLQQRRLSGHLDDR